MTVAEQWIQQGKKEGHQAGRQEGRQEGEAELLLWQLQEKFGPAVVERYREQIEQADEATIRTWSVCLLRAETIDVVFTDD